MKRVLSLLTLALAVITAYAYDFETEGLCFSLMSNGELSVAGISSSEGEYYQKGTLIIPDVVEYGREYKVTKIENKAFSGKKMIATATIGDAVTEIGSEAFADCSGLVEVTIGKSVKTINAGAFQGCKLLAKVNITDLAAWCRTYILPTLAENGAIEDFTACPFHSGAALAIDGEIVTTLDIPSSANSVRNYVFLGCSSFTSINFPSSVKSIGDYAFDHCEGLQSLEVPDNVVEMGIAAFSYCTKLESIKLGAGLSLISSSAFAYCDKLKDIEWGPSIKKIGSAAFFNCSSLTTLSWPSSLTALSSSCFSRTGLLEINIPGNIKEIPNNAFSNCSAAKSIIIADGVERIGSYAFFECNRVKTLKIGKSLSWIAGENDNAVSPFAECEALEEIIIDPENECYYCPAGSNTLINKATNTLLLGCTKSVIPNTVETIGSRAFIGYKQLKSIEIPSSVTRISDYAFSETGLTSIDIPSSVIEIGVSAFSETDLTAVVIPSSITEIKDYVFAYSKLEHIDIPSWVTRIGHGAFSCYTVKTVTCWRMEPPIADGFGFVYDSTYKTAPLYVPEGSAELYRTTWPWSQFKNIKEFPTGDGVETVSIDALDPTAPVEVYDLHGRRLGGDLGALPSGIYLVKQGSRLCKVAR